MTLTRQRHDGTSRFSTFSRPFRALRGADIINPNNTLHGTPRAPVASNFLTVVSTISPFRGSSSNLILKNAARFVAASAATSAFAVAAFANPVAARTRKIVGVPGWTSGSQTYLRARPGEDTPAVAKVPRHTKVYVWGTFQGWYRVETPDHTFGWVHNSVLNAPEAQKLAELSHRKARLASDRTSDQQMYGSAEVLKRHYALYGAPKNASKANSSTRSVATHSQKSRPAVAVVAKPVEKPTRAQTIAAKEAEVRDLEARARAAKAQLVAAQQESARLERLKATQQTSQQLEEARVLAHQKAIRLEQERQVKAQADAKLQEAAHQARLAQKQYQYKVQLAQQEKDRQNRVAAYKTRLAQSQINAEARHQKRLAVYQARAAAHQKRLAMRQLNAKTRQQRLAMQRTQLRQNMGTQTSTQSNAGAPMLPTNLRPLSPAELLKAREEYLNGRRSTARKTSNVDSTSSSSSFAAAPSSSSTSGSAPSPLNPASSDAEQNSSAQTSTEARVTPSSFSANANSLMPIVPIPSQHAVSAKLRPVVQVSVTHSVARPVVLASRGGSVRGVNRGGFYRGGSPRDYARPQGSLFGQTFAKQALSYRGSPYIMGAASPGRGFDCSGLIYFLLRQRGYNPPRTAAGLSHYGIAVPRDQLQPGDLVLFANTYKRGISHVGIYMGNNKFVHAANPSRGVSTNSLSEAYYARKYWGARRIK